MEARTARRMRARTFASNVALAVVYFAVARLGLLMDAVGGFATLVWPATGVALAATILLGYEVAPGIAVGALVTNLSIGAPRAAALGIAAGNTLEAVAGAWGLARFAAFRPSLRRVRDAPALVSLAGAGSTLVAATVGVASLAAAGVVRRDAIAATWRAWWIGDMTGAIVVAPLLLVFLAPAEGPFEGARPRRPRHLEAAALGLVLGATGVAVFGRWGAPRDAYLVFVPLVWAGVRFQARGAALAAFLVSAIAIAGTALGGGPFRAARLAEGLIHLQGFMASITAVTLILASAVDERQVALGLRDSLLSVASHELRTPLTSLKLRIQLLGRRVAADGASAERFGRDVALVDEQTARLGRLVDDLLDVSRIMSGQVRLDIEDVELGAFVGEIVDRCPDSERALVRVTGDAEPIVGRWDRMRIDQIVSNLLSNALKYGEGKPVEIALERGAGRARVVVRDHGPGIAPANLARIFERFERAASKNVSGFGLGLWIVRQLVAACGGTIAVTSQVGDGSTFVVELPLEPRERRA